MGSIAHDIEAGDEYKLPRGGREAVRLTAQHHVLTTRQGWLLHPTIAEAVKHIPAPKIADVATGTGVWATALARQMPHADIIGLDISDKQFCPEWLLPSNVSLGLYDLLTDVPAEFVGAFDVVHVRLLLAAGPSVDKQIFIDRFRSLLRPGGWLQWDDLQYPTIVACFQSLTNRNGVDVIGLEDHPVAQVCTKYFGMDKRNAWFSQFEEVVAEAGGFRSMKRYPVPVRPDLLQMESDLCLAVKTDLIEMVIHNKSIDDSAMLSELRGAISKMGADTENGVLFSYSWNVCIASKV